MHIPIPPNRHEHLHVYTTRPTCTMYYQSDQTYIFRYHQTDLHVAVPIPPDRLVPIALDLYLHVYHQKDLFMYMYHQTDCSCTTRPIPIHHKTYMYHQTDLFLYHQTYMYMYITRPTVYLLYIHDMYMYICIYHKTTYTTRQNCSYSTRPIPIPPEKPIHPPCIIEHIHVHV